ncbi:MAG: 7-carboxy-7-deazaguanine synthase QueE [bacterium]
MNQPEEILLQAGRILPVLEEFYSLQGEGYNTGKAAYFIRIGGCDVGCRWCDVKEAWNAETIPPVSTDAVIKRAASFPAKAIVVTGGEPLTYNLDYLCEGLKENKISRFLETSGSCALSGEWEWICFSPKKEAPPVREMYQVADELKVIIFNRDDFAWAEENRAKMDPSVQFYLQPEWSRRNAMMTEIVNYIKSNPGWKISLQSHKYMHIP